MRRVYAVAGSAVAGNLIVPMAVALVMHVLLHVENMPLPFDMVGYGVVALAGSVAALLLWRIAGLWKRALAPGNDLAWVFSVLCMLCILPMPSLLAMACRGSDNSIRFLFTSVITGSGYGLGSACGIASYWLCVGLKRRASAA